MTSGTRARYLKRFTCQCAGISPSHATPEIFIATALTRLLAFCRVIASFQVLQQRRHCGFQLSCAKFHTKSSLIRSVLVNQHIAEASEVAPGNMRRLLNQILIQALHCFPYDFKSANDGVLNKFRFQEGIASACGIALDAPDAIQNITAIRPLVSRHKLTASWRMPSRHSSRRHSRSTTSTRWPNKVPKAWVKRMRSRNL